MKRYILTFLVMLLGLAPCLMDAQTLTRGPYLQMGSTTATTVRWRTSSATGSVVKYGTSASNLNLTKSDTASKTEHELRLTGLSPNTKYFYSIGNGTTTYASGSDCFFVTAPTSAKPTRIWVLGDSGTGDANQANVRNAYYAFTGSRHTDLWLMLGDNAYQNGTDAEYQSTLFNVYGSMLRKSVMWSTLGNHDAFSLNSSNQGPYYNIHTLPTGAEAGGTPSGTEAYYSFDYGNIHFVCLDSMNTSRSPTGAMAQWLINDLENNTKDWLIVFFHHPPYSKGSHDSDTKPNLIEMRRHFAPILEDYGVDIVLAGHSHSYERSRFIRAHYDKADTFDSSYMVVQPGSGQGSGAYEKGDTGPMPNAGAVYFTAGSSGKLSDGQFNHPAMWVSMKVLGSVVLDVDGQRLDAKFIDNAGTTRDSFTLFKGTGIPPPAPIPGDNGIIVDNRDTGSVTITGGWSTSKSTYGYYETDYHHDGGSGQSSKTFKFTPNLPAAGSYEVFARWTAESNRASNARFSIAHSGGTTNVNRDQRTHNGMWRSLGVFNFNAGTSGSVTLNNAGTSGVVIADAISFVPQTSQPPPSGWTSQDIGSVGVPGSMSVNGGTIIVNGSGTTIGGTVDSFHFAHQTRTGDFTITARVVSQAPTHSYARAGVMIRDGLGAGAKLADMVLTPSQGSYMQSRTTTGGTVSSGSGGPVAAQYWVRVTRSGNDFKGYQSANGTSWTQVSSTKVISMPATVNVGLAVCSFNNGTLGTATFDNVVITTP